MTEKPSVPLDVLRCLHCGFDPMLLESITHEYACWQCPRCGAVEDARYVWMDEQWVLIGSLKEPVKE